MVPELDHVMAALLDDLKARGLLESTLVITLAEFGRTPEINPCLAGTTSRLPGAPPFRGRIKGARLWQDRCDRPGCCR